MNPGSLIDYTATFEHRETLPGSVGRVWGVSGETLIPEHMVTAIIKVQHQTDDISDAAWLAVQHEVGHVNVAEDVKDHFAADEAFTIYIGIDKFWNEVQAWVMGFKGQGTKDITTDQAHFVLDCLNSYRRLLPQGVTDEEWHEAVDIISEFYAGEEDLHDYEPLEPDPKTDRTDSCQPGLPTPESMMPVEDDEDEAEAEAEAEGDDEEPEDEEDDGPKMDNRWLQQDIIDAITAGKTIGQIADERGLDPTQVPPLVAVLAGGE